VARRGKNARTTPRSAPTKAQTHWVAEPGGTNGTKVTAPDKATPANPAMLALRTKHSSKPSPELLSSTSSIPSFLSHDFNAVE